VIGLFFGFTHLKDLRKYTFKSSKFKKLEAAYKAEERKAYNFLGLSMIGFTVLILVELCLIAFEQYCWSLPTRVLFIAIPLYLLMVFMGYVRRLSLFL